MYQWHDRRLDSNPWENPVKKLLIALLVAAGIAAVVVKTRSDA